MVEDNIKALNHIEDDKVHIECAVNTSPGTSEVRALCHLILFFFS